jgi:CheY-like chemotaxis protein
MCRVLVVEDEADDALWLMAMLAPHGYEVRLVYDGSKALASAHEFQPSVVILDYKMPLMGGADVAWQFHSDAAMKGVPIIICTGLYDGTLAAQFPPARQTLPILEKPVSAERLHEVLEAALANGQS